MNSTKQEFAGFTPGPWNVAGNEIFSIDNDALVAAVFSGAESQKLLNKAIPAAGADANARLIAAAPALLAERDNLLAVNAELVAALSAIHEGDVMSAKYGKAHMFSHADVVAEYQSIARAALNKAKGE